MDLINGNYMDTETRALMRELAEESAEKAVRRTLTALGIDHENPLEVQKDLAALRELRMLTSDVDFQKDMLHLRKWRKTMDSVENRGVFAALGMAIIGGLALIITGIKFKFFS